MTTPIDSGNTATSISPAVIEKPTENDMNMVRRVFESMANSVVEATQLAADVAALRNAVNSLQADVHSYRSRIQEQDGIIQSLRSQRDQALTDLEGTERQFNSGVQRIQSLEGELEVGRNALTEATKELASTRRERDDAQLRVMELEESLAKANTLIDKTHNMIKDMQEFFKPGPTPVETLPNPIGAGPGTGNSEAKSDLGAPGTVYNPIANW